MTDPRNMLMRLTEKRPIYIILTGSLPIAIFIIIMSFTIKRYTLIRYLFFDFKNNVKRRAKAKCLCERKQKYKHDYK